VCVCCFLASRLLICFTLVPAAVAAWVGKGEGRDAGVERRVFLAGDRKSVPVLVPGPVPVTVPPPNPPPRPKAAAVAVLGDTLGGGDMTPPNPDSAGDGLIGLWGVFVLLLWFMGFSQLNTPAMLTSSIF
jgi:hypothetical protein